MKKVKQMDTMDGTALTHRVEAALSEDAVRSNVYRFHLPSSVQVGQTVAPAETKADASTALLRARANLASAIEAQNIARIEVARNVLLGATGIGAQLAAARAKVADAEDLVCAFEQLAS